MGNPEDILKRKRREPEDVRRARILNAGEKLFLRNGFSGASMRDIAKAAGVSLGNLYNHFAGKEEIFDALIELRSPATEIESLIEFIKSGEFPGNLFEVAKAIKNIVDRNMVFIRLTDIDGIEFGGRKTLQVIGETIMRVAPSLMELYQRDRDKGLVREFDANIGLPFIVLVLLAIFVLKNRFGAFWLLGGAQGQDEDRTLREMTDIIMYGILPRNNPSVI